MASCSWRFLHNSSCILYIVFNYIAIPNSLGVYPNRLWDFPDSTATRRSNTAWKGNDMQRCSTRRRLLFIAPALFILLQVALALHRHHFESYHDDNNSLHSFPEAFYSDHIRLDTLIRLAAALLSISLCLWIRSPDSPEAAVTVLIADPPQSRAPPSSIFS